MQQGQITIVAEARPSSDIPVHACMQYMECFQRIVCSLTSFMYALSNLEVRPCGLCWGSLHLAQPCTAGQG